MNFFEPEFLNRKTKFTLRTKYYMSEYDVIMNRILLYYQKV